MQAIERTDLPGFEQSLKECGVTEASLTEPERTGLDREGYLVLGPLLDSGSLNTLRTAFDRGINPVEKGGQSGHAAQSGTRHSDGLACQDRAFDILYSHPKILACVHRVLDRPFKVGQLSGREPLPGFGQQGLHSDWHLRSPADPFSVVTCIWMLDDFTLNNGATRVVPATHLVCSPIPKAMTQPASRHPQQQIVVGEAGSCLIFNGHLWHSGTLNQSKNSRRSVQIIFVGRDEMRYHTDGGKIPDGLPAHLRCLWGG